MLAVIQAPELCVGILQSCLKRAASSNGRQIDTELNDRLSDLRRNTNQQYDRSEQPCRACGLQQV